ncbi:hydrolase [Prochlorothrix hollandica PCC 9006 = CALU 1027]|uniref:Hydrolase n=1 Tax=Prochlorothrix hollandica PCC 9006 = CALU 1027 TaxID=317619 RepID=A0A0M2PWN2_PROHO|nr:hydrolase [Prochlorothrix hollandica PCC 9006 = CALU 1027]
MAAPSGGDRPKVIFLDAVGTLFGVRGSVGQIYQAVAQSFGVDAPSDRLNQAFFQEFRAAPPMAFPHSDPATIPHQEYQWWEAIARNTFQQAGVLEQFADFPQFFQALYQHFATAQPWLIYPDVLPALKGWRSQGIELGIISNFDSRLYAVLNALNLSSFFSSVTISTEVGTAKPNPHLFQASLQKHQIAPHQAWHIGDSHREDYQGAKAVGLRAIWIRRAVG